MKVSDLLSARINESTVETVVRVSALLSARIDESTVVRASDLFHALEVAGLMAETHGEGPARRIAAPHGDAPLCAAADDAVEGRAGAGVRRIVAAHGERTMAAGLSCFAAAGSRVVAKSAEPNAVGRSRFNSFLISGITL